MDKLDYYRSCIQKILTQHCRDSGTTEDVESLLCFDTERDHYQLMRVGW